MAGTKTARLNIRLSERDRETFERAAQLKGKPLSEWLCDHARACARHDIAEETTTLVPDDDFDRFVEALDGRMTPAAQALLDRRRAWGR